MARADTDQRAAPPPEPLPGRSHRRALTAGAVGAVVALVAAYLFLQDPAGTSRNPELTAIQPDTPRSGFVERDGDQLVLDGAPYRFTGFNSFVMFGCGEDNEKIDTVEEREEFFGSLRPNGMVRVFLLSHTDLEEFDAVVELARTHGQRLVVVLTDAHAECGELGGKKDQAWYEGGYRGEYVDWVNTAVPRYKDDPTVAAWELINEPHDVDTAPLRAFFDEAGALVKKLAPRQLVSSGTQLPDTYREEGAYRELAASPGIDLVSLHEYDDGADVSHHLAPALEAAQAVDKPLFLGEWGLMAGAEGATDPETGDACHTADTRREVAEGKLSAYLEQPGVAGALYWSFNAEDLGDECNRDVSAGDPLVDLIREIAIPVPE